MLYVIRSAISDPFIHLYSIPYLRYLKLDKIFVIYITETIFKTLVSDIDNMLHLLTKEEDEGKHSTHI